MAHRTKTVARCPASTSSSNTTRGHALIVVAETSLRMFVDAVLRQAGYWTARALGPPEALGMAEQFSPFDVLVTGEVADSHELARQLCQIAPNLKVLYLGSSDPRPDDRVTLQENELCLETPLTAGAILNAVSLLLFARSPRVDESRDLISARLHAVRTHDADVRILLVEDDVTYARYVQEMLQSARSARFQVAHTTSVHGAIDRLASAAPDIVLLDLGLPDAQELEALTAVIDAAPNLPIVILSGTDNEGFALEAVKAGAQDYLFKGEDTTPELLVKAIRYGIERKQSELHMKRLAYYDSLTGLPNRRLLMEHVISALKRAVRNRSVVGVFFIDIDRFKQINDTLGHEAGDRVLQQLATGLSQALRASDTLARLSGDEFVAVVEVAQPRQLAVVAASLQHRLKTPSTTTAGEVFVTASIGVSVYPTDGDDAEGLLRRADDAMYRAKAQGRDTVRFYADARKSTRSSQVAFRSALQRAIERGELLVLFQPIVNLHTSQVDGLEALVRWRHPSRGVIPPSDFIPIAEESGLILLIERWVLHTAMTEAAKHRSTRQLKLAINLSRRHFDNPTLLKELKSIVRQAGYDACLLELELTESGIMHHPKRVLRHLKECRRLGISVAVDDFGTGYSCLGLMKRFPLSALKIDRSFVHNCGADPTNRALVAAIISVGHALGLQVTAEGVETAAELKYLRDQNCDRAQGYYFSRPVQSARLRGVLSHDRIDGSAARFRVS